MPSESAASSTFKVTSVSRGCTGVSAAVKTTSDALGGAFTRNVSSEKEELLRPSDVPTTSRRTT